jgi:hypothetical protein
MRAGQPRSVGLLRTTRNTSRAANSTATPIAAKLARQPITGRRAARGAAATMPPRLATDVQAPVSVPNSRRRNHCAMILAAAT